MRRTLPEAISVTTQPSDQTSAARPCPDDFMNTSGAMYAAHTQRAIRGAMRLAGQTLK